jgi:hypothetical protein
MAQENPARTQLNEVDKEIIRKLTKMEWTVEEITAKFNFSIDNITFALDEKKAEDAFPLLFKQAIRHELNSALANEPELTQGRFVKEKDLMGFTEYGGEYMCFDFKRFKGCKLLIGSFSKYCPHAGIWLLLFIDKDSIEKDRLCRFEDLLYADTEEYRFCEFSKHLIGITERGRNEGDWVNLTESFPYNESYTTLGEFDPPKENTWLFLDEKDYIEPYKENYLDVASIIGKRAKYWFDNGKILDNADDSIIPIIDFLEIYLGKSEIAASSSSSTCSGVRCAPRPCCSSSFRLPVPPAGCLPSPRGYIASSYPYSYSDHLIRYPL